MENILNALDLKEYMDDTYTNDLMIDHIEDYEWEIIKGYIEHIMEENDFSELGALDEFHEKYIKLDETNGRDYVEIPDFELD
tara:strand:- start:166 stop:411 length:246 start_codon:yes stop_codon:yes gene_type:complete